MYNRFVYL